MKSLDIGVLDDFVDGEARQVRLANQFLEFERLGQPLLGAEASEDRDLEIQVRARFRVHDLPPTREYRPRRAGSRCAGRITNGTHRRAMYHETSRII